jgi:hypothetical protein
MLELEAMQPCVAAIASKQLCMRAAIAFLPRLLGRLSAGAAPGWIDVEELARMLAEKRRVAAYAYASSARRSASRGLDNLEYASANFLEHVAPFVEESIPFLRKGSVDARAWDFHANSPRPGQPGA